MVMGCYGDGLWHWVCHIFLFKTAELSPDLSGAARRGAARRGAARCGAEMPCFAIGRDRNGVCGIPWPWKWWSHDEPHLVQQRSGRWVLAAIGDGMFHTQMGCGSA